MNSLDLDNILIFSGEANPKLAEEIAAYLELEVSPAEFGKVSNDNLEAQLGVSVRRKDVFIVQPLTPPTSDHLMQLLLMLDIARTSGAKSIHAIIPYHSYARSDKKDAPRISIAARLVADLLVTSGAEHIITMTLHSPQVHGFFSIPTDALTAQSVLVDFFNKQDLTNTVVVSPDMGNSKRASKLARSLKLPIAVAEKMRLSDAHVEVSTFIGDVEGKRVLLFDDEIATGSTIIELVRVLRERGAGPITVICTHGLFCDDAAEKLNAVPEIEQIVTTNTVYVPPGRRPAKLETLPVGEIFGEVIRCSIEGDSVGPLFEWWTD